jgi:hypothetical protein
MIALVLMLAVAVSWPASELYFIAEAQAQQQQLAPGPDRAWWEDAYTPRKPQYNGVRRASLYIRMRDGY